MLDVTVIILTKDEKQHIGRCLDNVNQFASDVYVVDCFSTDGTQDIAKSYGANVIEHQWPGNQAEQFNWALDNLPINTEWILRLDADEYLTTDLQEELEELIPTLPEGISGLVFPLGRAFMGRVLKHGIVNGVSMIRMFRRGKARYEHRIMDEHLLIDGDTYTCKGKFIDDNRMPLSFFIQKHNGYAAKEAALLLYNEFNLNSNTGKESSTHYATAVERKRSQKNGYARLPLFWRAFAYFCYRYFFKLGFLDGKEGFLWDFFQGWWYRTLVDAKVLEIKRACGCDPEKIKTYLEVNCGIKL